jgi:hypothetical protein
MTAHQRPVPTRLRDSEGEEASPEKEHTLLKSCLVEHLRRVGILEHRLIYLHLHHTASLRRGRLTAHQLHQRQVGMVLPNLLQTMVVINMTRMTTSHHLLTAPVHSTPQTVAESAHELGSELTCLTCGMPLVRVRQYQPATQLPVLVLLTLQDSAERSRCLMSAQTTGIRLTTTATRTFRVRVVIPVAAPVEAVNSRADFSTKFEARSTAVMMHNLALVNSKADFFDQLSIRAPRNINEPLATSIALPRS